MSIGAEILEHFGAGVAVAGADYATYLVTNKRSKRIDDKKEVLKSIDFILKANPKPAEAIVEEKPEEKVKGTATAEKSLEDNVKEATVLPKAEADLTDSSQYAINIEVVKSYFTKTGTIKQDLSLFKKVKNFFHDLIYTERINNLSNVGKLGFALGAEILYDTAFGFAHYTQVKGQTPIGSWANNIYQVPAFCGGLIAGNALKKGFNYMVVTGEERKLEKGIAQFVRESEIVDLVLQYEPSEHVNQVLEDQGIESHSSKLTRAGEKMYKKLGKKIGDAAYKVTHYNQMKREEQEKESQALKDRFDELTKGK